MSDKVLRKISDVLKQFRLVDPEMPMQTVATFLNVALKPGVTIGELHRRLKVSGSSASRNVLKLSDRRVNGKRGHGLVEYRLDPDDYRRREIQLTRQGARVANKIMTILGD